MSVPVVSGGRDLVLHVRLCVGSAVRFVCVLGGRHSCVPAFPGVFEELDLT